MEERVLALEKVLARLAPSALPVQWHRLSPSAGVDLAQRIREALKEVIDPGAGVSVVELGLIRDIAVDGGQVEVRMVLTTPDCPLVEYLVNQIRRKVASINGIKAVEVTLLDEPWHGNDFLPVNQRENGVGNTDGEGNNAGLPGDLS